MHPQPRKPLVGGVFYGISCFDIISYLDNNLHLVYSLFEHVQAKAVIL